MRSLGWLELAAAGGNEDAINNRKVAEAMMTPGGIAQWGSCTARGTVRLNWQLVKMPLRLVDYVVVHELAHLIELNHSAAFWRVVEAACPDYVKLRRELRKWSLMAE